MAVAIEERGHAEVAEEESAKDMNSVSSVVGTMSPATPASGAEMPSPLRA